MTGEFASFARAVAESVDVPSARRTVVRLAVELTPASAAALTRRGTPRPVVFAAASDEIARRLVRGAEQAREGVCWQVHAESRPVVCPDLARETRWPAYCRAAGELAAVRTVVGLPLSYTGQLIGALLLYADQPGGFADRQLTEALALADHAALALTLVASRVKVANLEVALRTNREIAIAVGIVMDRFRLPEEQAFDHLRRASELGHVKLRDVAAQVALTGEVPTLRSA